MRDYLKKKIISENFDFEEILLIGSGKGITSVSKIDQVNWKRKKTVCYRKLNKLYNSLI